MGVSFFLEFKNKIKYAFVHTGTGLRNPKNGKYSDHRFGTVRFEQTGNA
jgi:hypothetical protein